MPAFTSVVSSLNREFHEERIKDFARRADSFAPGKPLDPSLILDPSTPQHRLFKGFLERMPGSFTEIIRGVIHHALSASPPRQVIFAWAPAYDWEVTVWDAPCGITVMVKSRYPADRLPAEASQKDA